MNEGLLTEHGRTLNRLAGSAGIGGRRPDEVLRTIKIKTHSKLDALDKLGKSLRLFTEKLEVSGGLDIAAQLSAARRRARFGKEGSDRDEA